MPSPKKALSLVRVVATAAAMAAMALIGPSRAETVPSAVYATAQRLIALDGFRRLNLYCEGSGSPTVVLDAGAGDGMAAWRYVQAEVAKVTRVCAYDRAGLGFSDAADRPFNLRGAVEDLHSLTSAARIPAPFIYVGHSLAGAIGLLYVATYPDDIAGAVLVDPAFAGELQAMQAVLPPENRKAMQEAFERSLEARRACLALARKGMLAEPSSQEARDCLLVDWDGDPALDPALRQTMVRLQTLPRVWEAQISERQSFLPQQGKPDGLTAELEGANPSFGAKPLAVLTRGVEQGGPGVPAADTAKVEAEWRAGHDRLAALSKLGDDRIVPGAGHYIQIDRPQAVIDAVRRVVAVARLK